MSESLADNCNTKCYCGKDCNLYSGLFERNFCSEVCITNLTLFFGTIERIAKHVENVKIHGDFKISGGTVTLLQNETRAKNVIDRIDSEVDASIKKINENEAHRRKLRRLGFDDETIEAMLQAKG